MPRAPEIHSRRLAARGCENRRFRTTLVLSTCRGRIAGNLVRQVCDVPFDGGKGQLHGVALVAYDTPLPYLNVHTIYGRRVVEDFIGRTGDGDNVGMSTHRVSHGVAEALCLHEWFAMGGWEHLTRMSEAREALNGPITRTALAAEVVARQEFASFVNTTRRPSSLIEALRF